MVSLFSNSNEGPIFSFFQLVWLVSLGISGIGHFSSLELGFFGVISNLVAFIGFIGLILYVIVGLINLFSN